MSYNYPPPPRGAPPGNVGYGQMPTGGPPTGGPPTGGPPPVAGGGSPFMSDQVRCPVLCIVAGLQQDMGELVVIAVVRPVYATK